LGGGSALIQLPAALVRWSSTTGVSDSHYDNILCAARSRVGNGPAQAILVEHKPLTFKLKSASHSGAGSFSFTHHRTNLRAPADYTLV